MACPTTLLHWASMRLHFRPRASCGSHDSDRKIAHRRASPTSPGKALESWSEPQFQLGREA
jgi:hypothetical protein